MIVFFLTKIVNNVTQYSSTEKAEIGEKKSFVIAQLFKSREPVRVLSGYCQGTYF